MTCLKFASRDETAQGRFRAVIRHSFSPSSSLSKNTNHPPFTIPQNNMAMSGPRSKRLNANSNRHDVIIVAASHKGALCAPIACMQAMRARYIQSVQSIPAGARSPNCSSARCAVVGLRFAYPKGGGSWSSPFPTMDTTLWTRILSSGFLFLSLSLSMCPSCAWFSRTQK